jgi:hypothetical protein
MKLRRQLWVVVAACAAAALLLAAGQTVSAQCSLCRSALAGAPEAAKLSERLNLAIIVLLIPPVAIFCGIFYAIFRGKHGAKTRFNPLRLTSYLRASSAKQPFAQRRK